VSKEKKLTPVHDSTVCVGIQTQGHMSC